MEALKFIISSPNQSKRLQKILFDKLGAYWHQYSKDIANTDATYIFMEASGELSWEYAGRGGFEGYAEYKTKDTEKFIAEHSVKKAKKIKWHSVADGLPESHLVDFLIVCEDDSSIMMAYVACGKWCHSRNNERVNGVIRATTSVSMVL